MTANLNIVCMHETEVFLRLVLEKYEEYANDDICHAANWVIQQLRSEVKNVARIGYIFDRDYFHGAIEKETPLTTNGIYTILHECQVFHHHELRFSVEEEPFRMDDAVPTRKYVPEYPNDSTIADLFKCVEHKQKIFCPPVAEEERLFDENDVSFTEFLKKLENRQRDIMKRFQSVSFSSSDGEGPKGVELALEALTEDVFQPQLSGPEHEIFFDTSDNFGEQEPLLEPSEDIESFLDKIIEELLGKVDSLGVKNRRYEYTDDLISVEEKKAAEWTDELSKMEKETHLEALTKKSDPRSKLSMTVATSTFVEGKYGQIPAETQTDKESGSEDEIAIIRHALSVIQKKRRKMSSIGKKSPEMKKKKLRLSRSPKCCCCRKEKKETEKVEKKTPEKVEKKKEKKEKKTDSWPLGPIGSEWKKEHKKQPFDLMAELEKALPTVSEPEEPFNRKLREKWAHDGMKSLKRNTLIHSVRMPASSKIPSRFHRFQPAEGHHQDDDQYCDKFNLARLDGKLYKLVPRFSGITTPLNKNYPGHSSVPTTVHMAVVDESDPWLNWDMHYLKTYRALNIGSKVLKGLRVHVIQSSNVEIARDLSKIPVYVPMDYSVDFQLVFNLIDKEKDGHCVMQLKDEEGVIVSPAFVFLGSKIERSQTPVKTQSEVYDSSEESFEVPEVVSSSEAEPVPTEQEEEGQEQYLMVSLDDCDFSSPDERPISDFVFVSEDEI